MLRPLDDMLNNITMYRLVTYGLLILAGIAVALGYGGQLGVPGTRLLLSLLAVIASGYAANKIISRTWQVPTNSESWLITALIVFFIMPPAAKPMEYIVLVLASVLAMASKFLLAWQGKHIFNPAAIGGAIVSLLSMLPVTWWVGSKPLFPMVLVLGLLVVRKIRRFALFLTFAAVSLLAIALTAHSNGQELSDAVRTAVLSSPLLFLGTIMLTEPATMPSRRSGQIIFGALVGLLYAMAWKIAGIRITPEIALLLGNVYAFAVNPRYRLRLQLKEIQRISDKVYNYVFIPDRHARFMPGQYMEFTLAHAGADSRGNRRTLSIASSPTESEILLGVKHHDPSSSYKKALAQLQPGDVLYGGQLAGDFTLPKSTREKLLFLAAGIGITPFRSMLKYLVDTGEQRDIVLIYAVSDPYELAYIDVLRQAVAAGVRVLPLLTSAEAVQGWQGLQGKLDTQLIASQVPDYHDRKIYLSGPNAMVENVSESLLASGVRRGQLKTDHFTGY